MRLIHLLAAIILCSLAAGGAASTVPVPDGYVPPFWPEGKPLEGLVITVDPGHGGSSFSEGYHGSARGRNTRVVEGDLNMVVSALVYHHLKDAGAEVHLTRSDDRKVTLGATGRAEELGARPALAESTRSHLFLSIHHNSTARDTAHGVVVLIWPTDSEGEDQPLERAFAGILREEVDELVPSAEEFGHYMIEHPLVMDTDLPSAVIEYGFLSNEEFDAWVARPTSPKIEARATYNAVVRMWEEHREELEELRDRLLPEPEAVDSAPASLDDPFPLGRPSAAAWGMNRPAESAKELSFAARAWRNATSTDRTTFHLNTQVRGDAESGYTLSGWTTVPQLGAGMAAELSRVAGQEVGNEVVPLPDLPEGVSPFGIMQIPMAMTWSNPRELGGFETQLLYGEPLFLLRRTPDEDYYLVQGLDGYTGWVRADAVRQVSRGEFTELLTEPAARVQRNTMKDDFRIPPASRLLLKGVEGDEAMVQLADGSEWTMPVADLLLPEERPSGEEAARLALEEYLYVPYVFGGRSTLGLDCSGFTGAAWANVGVQLPRDANQQALVGQLAGTAWYREALLPGDVLFFVDTSGRVIHSALSLGGSRYIHASPPEVQINSFDPEDPLYSATWDRAFAIARRPAP